MMYLFYSDLHVRPERLDDCEKVLNAIHDECKSLRDSGLDVTIINGGDTFNTRGVIRTKCFDVLAKHYRKWSDDNIPQIILVGNHDQEDLGGEIHPMRVFSGYGRGWHVIDEPKIVGEFVYFPYMEKSLVKKFIDKNVSKIKGKYAAAHWGITGAMMNDFIVDSTGVPSEWLSIFKRVFAGHYHYRNSFQNVQYIGSPMQQTFSEADQDKGVLIFDSGKNKVQFKEILGTPKFRKIDIEVSDKGKIVLPDADVSDGDFCKFIISGDADRCSLISKDMLRSKYGVSNVTVERNVRDRHFSRLDIKSSDVDDVGSILTKYVSFVDTDLDRKKLLSIGMEMIGL